MLHNDRERGARGFGRGRWQRRTEIGHFQSKSFPLSFYKLVADWRRTTPRTDVLSRRGLPDSTTLTLPVLDSLLMKEAWSPSFRGSRMQSLEGRHRSCSYSIGFYMHSVNHSMRSPAFSQVKLLSRCIDLRRQSDRLANIKPSG